MFNPYNTIEASFITLGRGISMLCPSDEIRHGTHEQDHPARRVAPPLEDGKQIKSRSKSVLSVYSRQRCFAVDIVIP